MYSFELSCMEYGLVYFFGPPFPVVQINTTKPFSETPYTSINSLRHWQKAIVVLASAADLASLAGFKAHYHIVYLLTKVYFKG